MILSRSELAFPFADVARGSVATIGSFDGLHLGHQQLLDQVQSQALALGVPSVVLSFEPTPKEFFARDKPPARLMRFREKFRALADRGIDIFFCPRFSGEMRDIGADDFIRRILVHALNTRHLVVGDDFRFARGRSGDIHILRRAGSALGFSVADAESVVCDGVRVSSTAVRDALWRGDLDVATRLLGRPYRMSGKVIEGRKMGRQLGYPTANVNLNRKQSAVMGIFAVRVSGMGWGPRDAVASVGTRPTFGASKPVLEVHVFDFDENIYGQYIDVDFVARLRNEEKYDDIAALIEQMHRDASRAREILAA